MNFQDIANANLTKLNSEIEIKKQLPENTHIKIDNETTDLDGFTLQNDYTL